jgi:hypothetical protein
LGAAVCGLYAIVSQLFTWTVSVSCCLLLAWPAAVTGMRYQECAAAKQCFPVAVVLELVCIVVHALSCFWGFYSACEVCWRFHSCSVCSCGWSGGFWVAVFAWQRSFRVRVRAVCLHVLVVVVEWFRNVACVRLTLHS